MNTFMPTPGRGLERRIKQAGPACSPTSSCAATARTFPNSGLDKQSLKTRPPGGAWSCRSRKVEISRGYPTSSGLRRSSIPTLAHLRAGSDLRRSGPMEPFPLSQAAAKKLLSRRDIASPVVAERMAFLIRVAAHDFVGLSAFAGDANVRN